MQKSASRAPDFVLSCQPRAERVEQHAVQVESRVNENRLAQSQRHISGFGSREHRFSNQFLGRAVVDQKRILTVGFVRQAAAAGFLPGELLVEDDGLEPGGAELLGGKRARRSSSQNGDALHCLGVGLTAG